MRHRERGIPPKSPEEGRNPAESTSTSPRPSATPLRRGEGPAIQRDIPFGGQYVGEITRPVEAGHDKVSSNHKPANRHSALGVHNKKPLRDLSVRRGFFSTTTTIRHPHHTLFMLHYPDPHEYTQ